MAAAGQELFVFRLRISHAKTVGTGACGGCLEPVTIFLSAVRIVPGTAPNLTLTQGANYSGSQWVSWQQGYPVNIQHRCSGGAPLFCFFPYTSFDCVPYSPTPSRNSTWGQVKSLYR